MVVTVISRIPAINTIRRLTDASPTSECETVHFPDRPELGQSVEDRKLAAALFSTVIASIGLSAADLLL